jgi:hypothetical protein
MTIWEKNSKGLFYKFFIKNFILRKNMGGDQKTKDVIFFEKFKKKLKNMWDNR